MAAGSKRQRLIVVSNRLPVALSQDADGKWNCQPGSGGLVSALLPILRHRGGVWIGWPGTEDFDSRAAGVLARAGRDIGLQLRSVILTKDEVRGFYRGFSNEIVWPLFHDLQSLCNFDPTYWRVYLDVNRKFAATVAREAKRRDFVWVHDYHLIHVGSELRRRRARMRTAFFLHTPFPSLDVFAKLPWRFEILRALLDYDLVGFQTLHDRRNFVECLRTLANGMRVFGSGQVLTVVDGKRRIRVGTFPISIDYNSLLRRAGAPEVAAKVSELHHALPNRQRLLGIDRLDYTKGIPYRLLAFRNALQRYPKLRERVTLIQVVVPSREQIPQYHDLKARIEGLVGEINGEFTRPGGWVPIHYVYRHLSQADLLAYYRGAEIALVTPLKDGMNLVAKEYSACSIEEDCVLILSEFAGAAAQLQNGALLVNPYDIEGVADAIHTAYAMPMSERRARMRRIRRSVRQHDVYEWLDSFIHAGIAKDLSAFPLPEDFVPRENGIAAEAAPTNGG
jgi:trehalose 6-phosphate synthase